MPAWKNSLSADEIEAVARYERECLGTDLLIRLRRPALMPADRRSIGRRTGPFGCHTPSLRSRHARRPAHGPPLQLSPARGVPHARHHRVRHPARGRPARPSGSRSTSPAGLPGFTIVGLPDASCREARDRVRAAMLSSGLTWPNRRVTVNLAPSGVRKAGAGLDLAIAIGLLVADEQVPAAVVGRHRLHRRARASTARSGRCPGALPLVDALDVETVVLAPGSAVEAQLVGRHVDPRRVDRSPSCWPASPATSRGRRCRRPTTCRPQPDPPDLADVRGQPRAPLRARGRGRRRSPPADDRATRVGQDHAGPAAARAAARRSTTTTPSRPPGCTRPPASRCRRAGWCGGRRSGRRTTARRRWPSSAAAAPTCSPARSPSPPTACCSSTSWPSSTSTCSTRCASRSRKASSGWPGPATAPPSRPGSSWSAP